MVTAIYQDMQFHCLSVFCPTLLSLYFHSWYCCHYYCKIYSSCVAAVVVAILSIFLGPDHLLSVVVGQL